ncbi:MAG: multiheme c-type cytochrome [Planctomycetota bacterium]
MATLRGRTWAIVLVCLALGFLSAALFADWWIGLPTTAQAEYVGRSSCVTCHAREAALYAGSHHDQAMDVATDESVRGDFNDATLEHHDITSRMFRRDGRFFVNTEGPDGQLADFEVKYVLGVDPLQNYMVEFDRPDDMPAHEIARLQVLRITWDTQGKRWFYLNPPGSNERLAPDDLLNWTSVAQRWNTMCADCHSTNLQKNFDVASGIYHTTFSEIDVSCESCHGPGSLHVQLASARSLFWDRKLGYGLAPLKAEPNDHEIHACAPCHARRRQLAAGTRPGDNFYDAYSHSLLEPTTYHADGQIQDEVYEFGSFTQSKMYHKNIRCSNCHDPHSAKLKHPGNQLCTSCHAHSAGKYDGPSHHHHEPNSSGAQCVNCHMPETHYMDVDPRRDHSLRVPRPGMSVELGTPNACTQCHLQVDKSVAKLPESKRAGLKRSEDWLPAAERDGDVRAELQRMDKWCADAARRWWGTKADDPKHYAYTLQAAREHPADTMPQLKRLARDKSQPSLARATAIEHLAALPIRETLNAAADALHDDHPAVRLAALQRFENELLSLRGVLESGQPPNSLINDYRTALKPLRPLLADPRAVIRLETTRLLAMVPEALREQILTSAEQRQYKLLLKDVISGLQHDNDRAGGHMNLALFYERADADRQAEAAYRQAIVVEPLVAGARSNLAQLLDRRAARLLQSAANDARGAAATNMSTDPASTDPVKSEKQRAAVERLQTEARALRQDELPLLRRDAEQLPEDIGLQYRYAMSLYLNEEPEAAIAVLLPAAQRQPAAENVLLGLALLYQKTGQLENARTWAQRLVDLQPKDPSYQQLLQELTAPPGRSK